MEPVIAARGLRRVYRVFEKPPGLFGALRGLFSRRYREVAAVDGIDLEIGPGELVGFLGPNGAGKTTTLKMLSGLLHPSGGSARVLGFTPWEREPEFRRQISLLLGQKNQLTWDLPARESFELNRAIYGIDRATAWKTVDELSSLLEVGGLLDKPVRELSLGERMKMELIAALLHQPKVLFLDEPTLGLDIVSQHRIRDFLRGVVAEKKITTILTSHYLQDIEALCRRVVIIDRGRIIHDGSLAAVVKGFSNHKQIELRFSGRAPKLHGPEWGEILSRDEAGVRLRVEPGRVTEISRRALDLPGLEDIRIESVPVEEVIRKLFSGK
ncbi:MAG: ATP-binding cassette domain-containing protein [Verrucomicrobia bacterium]|nr:ATP-binding cassette domain-containing protein [bacterium]NDA09224.1 ATP-binding cassette domain-containing protein [Verrucomicrobiota bacterium]NDA25277.1 ATP-binding cassette domain-containing protein [Verrucomicrobiota bacterium]NDD56304.1 ATP-binding cassette domain-containing protein [Verrucomicrobiota bacterium]NDD81022.1 ATP-binding cassette domain-containing protein [Verrucomicrobiota bacterium]